MNTRTTSEGGEGLDRLFRFLPDAGLWLDTNGRVMAANAGAEQLFNAPEEVIAGKHLAELWEEDDGFALAAMVKLIVANLSTTCSRRFTSNPIDCEKR